MAKAKKKTASKKAPAKAKAKTKSGGKKKAAGGGRGKANAAFMAPMQPSAALAEVVGDKAMPRTEVTKRLWNYIRTKKLQDPENRRNIRADEALAKVFRGKKVVSMFEMTKLVNEHLSAAT